MDVQHVSFSFESTLIGKFVIIRRNLTHTGHNVSDPHEGHVNKTHPENQALTEDWAIEGKSVYEIIVQLKKYNQAQPKGQSMSDRRYYPSPADIRHIVSKSCAKSRDGHHAMTLLVWSLF